LNVSKWVAGLNPEQAEAALHNNGPLLILAGAGSGKTTVLVARAGRLIDEKIVEARRLCVLTFTNKAARELKTRVVAKLGGSAKGIFAGTFHSFGMQLLREHYKAARLPKDFGILDQSDAGSIVKELLKDFNCMGKKAFDADTILNTLGQFREQGRTEAKKDEEYEAAVEWLLPRYLKRLEHLGMVDFDGLLLQPLELMNTNPEIRLAIQESYGQVMVDEFQDTNLLQMRFLKALVENHRNLSVVGDDDQSIYGWRGACVSNILDFPKMYSGSKVVRLERNYRSTPAILTLANAVIAKNTTRHSKVLKAQKNKDTGDTPELYVYENEDEEAEYTVLDILNHIQEGAKKRDIAVLYRSNGQGAALEAELRKHQIPYLLSGGTAFFDRRETRDVLAYLRCGLKPNEIALRRVLNVPNRGIGDATMDALTEFSRSRNRTFLDALRSWRDAGVEERAGKSIEGFLALTEALVPEVLRTDTTTTAGQRLIAWFQTHGYKAFIDKNAPNAMVAAKRWRILEMFSGILDKFIATGGSSRESLKQFLDAMELRDALDEKKENEDRVQLMTLHACKGLEFPTVFLVGVEEDLIPHKVLGTDVTEERRLFYVGITRAQTKLVLSRACRRRRHGKWAECAPSRFLLEVPVGLFKEHAGPRPLREGHRRSMVADLFSKLDALDKKAAAKSPFGTMAAVAPAAVVPVAHPAVAAPSEPPPPPAEEECPF
jgi:superfamily I DNA/RNA helicase